MLRALTIVDDRHRSAGMELQTTCGLQRPGITPPPMRLCRQGGALSYEVIVEMTPRDSLGGGGWRRSPSNGRMGSINVCSQEGSFAPLLGLLEGKQMSTSIITRNANVCVSRYRLNRLPSSPCSATMGKLPPL